MGRGVLLLECDDEVAGVDQEGRVEGRRMGEQRMSWADGVGHVNVYYFARANARQSQRVWCPGNQETGAAFQPVNPVCVVGACPRRPIGP